MARKSISDIPAPVANSNFCQCQRCGQRPHGKPRKDGSARIFLRPPKSCPVDKSQLAMFGGANCPVADAIMNSPVPQARPSQASFPGALPPVASQGLGARPEAKASGRASRSKKTRDRAPNKKRGISARRAKRAGARNPKRKGNGK
jgi:hypothetical protein